jgi:hypothetical protein
MNMTPGMSKRVVGCLGVPPSQSGRGRAFRCKSSAALFLSRLRAFRSNRSRGTRSRMAPTLLSNLSND